MPGQHIIVRYAIIEPHNPVRDEYAHSKNAEISRNTLTSKAYDRLAYRHFQAEMEATR
jgi:hypothetical protein